MIMLACREDMKILPYDYYEIQTSLNIDEIVASLQLEVEQKKWLRFSRQHKLFEGRISLEGFKINRIIHSHNSFFPIIRGRFQETELGTRVKVRMSLFLYSMLFMCFWFGVLLWGIFATSIGYFFDKPVFLPALPFAFLFLVIGWIMMSYGFWKEAKKAKALLNEIIRKEKTS